MKRTLMLSVAVAALLAASCATTFTTSNGKLAYAEVKGTEKGNFRASERAVYILHPSFISINKPQENLDRLIEPKLKAQGANAAKELKVTYDYDFLAFLCSNFLPLFGVPNVEVSGTAVAQ